MDVSSFTEQLGAWWSNAEALIANAPEVAGIALALILGLGAALAFLVATGLWRAASAARMAAHIARVRNANAVGVRVLIARAPQGKLASIVKFGSDALKNHLTEFMFGGPFKLMPYPGKVDREDKAQTLLERAEADILIWAESPRGGKPCLRILARPTSPFEKRRPAQTLVMPKERSAWNPTLGRATAYAAAKQFRPALGRPQDFRAERLQPVVELLLSILKDAPKGDPRLIAEMQDDASSGALQLAAAGDEAWLDRSVELARSTLAEINRSSSPDRWIAAKVTLGRALRLHAEKRFDPVVVQESIAHLTEALEALRSEPRFKLAESAAQAITEGQRLLGARRKFSITGGRI